MITVSILEDRDVLQATDWIRQLELEYVGQSDTLLTNNAYGGSRINRLRWISVEEFCPAWVGKPFGKFRKKRLGMGRPWQPVSDYEVVRGPIPDNHQEKAP